MSGLSPTAWSRRDFLRAAGITAIGGAVAACAPGSSKGGGTSPGSTSPTGGASSGAQAASSAGSNLRGKTITIGMEAGSPYQKFYQAAAARFTDQTGINVKIVGVPHDSMHQQFLSDALAGGGAYDVYESDQPWIPEFASKGYLVQLDDRVSSSDRADFAGNTLDTVSYDGKLYALPFLVHNMVLYYRTDLLAQAGFSQPPTTWDDYRAYAKKLTAGGVYGTIIQGKQDGESAIHLETFIQQAGGDICDASFKPTIDSAAGLAAANLMTGLVFDDKATPPGLLNLTDTQGLFLQGKLALAACWPYLYSLAKDPSQSKVAGKFDVALAPGHPDQVGTTFSWGFAVAAGSKNRDAAWEWVNWATGTDMQTEFGKNQINPVPRKSAVAKVNADASLSDADRKAITTFAKSAEMSHTMPMTPVYPQWQNTMAVALSSIMSRSQSPSAALKTAQAQMSSATGG